MRWFVCLCVCLCVCVSSVRFFGHISEVPWQFLGKFHSDVVLENLFCGLNGFFQSFRTFEKSPKTCRTFCHFMQNPISPITNMKFCCCPITFNFFANFSRFSVFFLQGNMCFLYFSLFFFIFLYFSLFFFAHGLPTSIYCPVSIHL